MYLHFNKVTILNDDEEKEVKNTLRFSSSKDWALTSAASEVNGNRTRS